MRLLRALLVALSLLIPGAVAAQARLGAEEVRDVAAQALAAGDTVQAAELAQALLARDPDDVVALVILARARLEAGDAAGAVAPARRAHALGEGAARYAGARVAAAAYSRQDRFTLAQIWLRIARRDAPDARAVAALRSDYRAVADRNPLRASLSFGLEPTSNINGGSSSETIQLPGLPFDFVLDGEARALSGLRVELATALSYRVRRSETAAVFVRANLSGRTYVLSDSARERAPDVSGSDYAETGLTLSLERRWTGRDPLASGPGSLSLTFGQNWFRGSPYLRFGQSTYERSFVLGERTRMSFGHFFKWTDRLDEQAPSVVGVPPVATSYPGLGLTAGWTHQLRTRDVVLAAVTLQEQFSDATDTGYVGALLRLGFERADPILGARLGLGAELDWRSYGFSIYAEGEREDLRTTLRGSLGFPSLDLYGFYPSLEIEASRNESNTSLFDRDAFSVGFDLRSSF